MESMEFRESNGERMESENEKEREGNGASPRNLDFFFLLFFLFLPQHNTFSPTLSLSFFKKKREKNHSKSFYKEHAAGG